MARATDSDRTFALCVARFYSDLADRLVAGARAALEEGGAERIDEFDVPGAFELPMAARFAAQTGRYAGVVALGAVIRGETDHYEWVCGQASQGLMMVQLTTGVPCGFGVLTVDTMEQALDRVDGGSKRDTGRHAAEAVLAVLGVKEKLEERPRRAGFA